MWVPMLVWQVLGQLSCLLEYMFQLELYRANVFSLKGISWSNVHLVYQFAVEHLETFNFHKECDCFLNISAWD